jgi:hypothetical protein
MRSCGFIRTNKNFWTSRVLVIGKAQRTGEGIL